MAPTQEEEPTYLEGVTAGLQMVAELFEQSLQHVFTRYEIIAILRMLPDEIAHQRRVQAQERQLLEMRPS